MVSAQHAESADSVDRFFYAECPEGVRSVPKRSNEVRRVPTENRPGIILFQLAKFVMQTIVCN